MSKTVDEKIESIKEEIEHLKNRQKRLRQQYNAQERKDRTKRLCRRMGLFESMLPETIPLTDDLFKSFLEKTILSESASKHISALLTEQNATAAAPIYASATAQPALVPVGNPTETEQGEATDEDADGDNGESEAG